MGTQCESETLPDAVSLLTGYQVKSFEGHRSDSHKLHSPYPPHNQKPNNLNKRTGKIGN